VLSVAGGNGKTSAGPTTANGIGGESPAGNGASGSGH
jgi:hypothetical protein